ncbi:MAG: SRPBCC family protein [Flavobacteriales bacterium]|nr:SRPBCC family protein [Flavobacteriales bacterium]
MVVSVTVTTIFECPLERAFRTPMLCDISKVHTGYGVMPKVTHCTDDAHWGRPGHGKKVFAAPSLTQKGGFISVDRVVERIENAYWKIEVSDFQSWMLGFHRFVGEWTTTALGPDRTRVVYTYSLHSDTPLLYPLNWIFAKVFWKRYMKRILENVRTMASDSEPYQYA